MRGRDARTTHRQITFFQFSPERQFYQEKGKEEEEVQEGGVGGKNNVMFIGNEIVKVGEKVCYCYERESLNVVIVNNNNAGKRLLSL